MIPRNALTSASSMSQWFSDTMVPANKGKHDLDGFNSIVGIVTALIGNVLISIALNTQRYAHIRLNKQLVERRKLLRRAERRRLKQQADASSEGSRKETRSRRSSISIHSPTNGSAGSYHNGNGEHEPLLAASRAESRESDDEADSDFEGKLEELSPQSYLKSPYWWVGIILMTIGEAGNFLAYGFAPASIVSPLGVVAIISNCIIAPIFMKEHFRIRDLWGVLIAVGGAVTVVLSASESNPKLGPHEIWELFATWEFKTYFGITVAAIVALMLASNKYGQRSIFIDLSLVGLFGGYTALSTKGVASLLSYTLFQALTFPILYLLVFVLVFTAIMQIKYVNRALQRFNATQVIPTQFVMFTLCVIIGSAVLYRDFERTSAEDAGKFIGGCAMTFIGVWLITSGKRPESESDDDEYDDLDEDAIVLRQGEQYQDDGLTNGSQTSIRGSIATSSINRRSRRFSGQEPDHRLSLAESLNRPNYESTESTASTPTRPSAHPLGAHASQSTTTVGGSLYSETPWEEETEPLTRRSTFRQFLQPLTSIFPSSSSPLEASRSAPEIPSITESTTSLPRTPLLHATDDPNLPDTPHHLHALPRNSFNSLYPGPFTSPLSSSLSAVVADSIRRRIHRRSRRSIARSRIQDIHGNLIPQRERGNSDPLDPLSGLESAAISDQSLDHDGVVESRESSRPGMPRRKSLGDRLGTFFGGKRKNGSSSKPGPGRSVTEGIAGRSGDDIV